MLAGATFAVGGRDCALGAVAGSGDCWRLCGLPLSWHDVSSGTAGAAGRGSKEMDTSGNVDEAQLPNL